MERIVERMKRRVQGTHVNGWPADGQEFETFRQVCEKLGLLEDDNHCDATMKEAVLCRSPSQIRELFAILICTCGLSNPLQLWDKYKVALSEDILHRFEKMDQVNNDLCLNEALIHIEDKIIKISGKKLSNFGMLTPQRRGELSTDLNKELNYNIALLDTQMSVTDPRLLPEQKDIYNKILQRVELGEGGLFLLDAPGGTGKTFLLNLLLAKIHNFDFSSSISSSSKSIRSLLRITGLRSSLSFITATDISLPFLSPQQQIVLRHIDPHYASELVHL
ncbi:ATP-dependent DNA helicase [Trichonephila clavipes]|nr:ATP-dependent DNA helicase [Trichonephila clavipes]